MSDPYEEIIEGETVLRFPPGTWHEELCARLHTQVSACLGLGTSARLLEPRAIVQLAPGTLIRPDLAIVTLATNKLWLAVEVINPEDHRLDTVVKKNAYEENKIPRLWMVDPRYDNVEIYHAGEYGLVLKEILAGRDVLTEKLLPEFQLAIADLFGAAT